MTKIGKDQITVVTKETGKRGGQSRRSLVEDRKRKEVRGGEKRGVDL